MRLLFVYSFILFLLSCSSIKVSNNIAPGYIQAFQSINTAIFGHEDNNIPKELIYELPYASMIVKIGKGPQGLMILESKKNKNELWISADKVFIGLKNGRITSTEGLDNNLTNLTISKTISDLSKVENSKVYKHYYSYDKPRLLYLEVEATYKSHGYRDVSLFDRKASLNLVEEHLRNKYLGWKATNRFWHDSDGFVWKSEQIISPKLPVIQIEVTKKPSS